MDPLDPTENRDGYIIHLEELLRDRQRIIKDLERKLTEVNRCAEIQEECANTFRELAEGFKAESQGARRKALEEASELRFMLRLPTPGTGPFTIQQMAVDDYSAAIKALIETTTQGDPS